MKKIIHIAILLFTTVNYANAQVSNDTIYINANRTMDVFNIRDNALGKLLFQLHKKDKFKIIGYQSKWFTIEYKNNIGYVSDYFFTKYEDMDTVIKKFNIINAERWRIEKDSMQSVYLNKLELKYGSVTGNAIFNHVLFIGMTEEMVRESIGFPERINSLTNKYGKSVQWVYPNKYVYFDDYKVSSWQESD